MRTYETAGSGFNVIVGGGASPLKVKAGKSATVNVELDNAKSVSYVSLVLSYDPDLTFKGAEFPIKASGDSTNVSVDAKTHTMTLSWSTNSAKSGDKTLAKLSFDTAADVFVNPTYEDNYPTTNLEAQACGTPVVTYDTGGSPESVPPENVVPVGDLGALAARIKELSA